MDLSQIYYSIEAMSSPELMDYMVQLDDDEIEEEMAFEDTTEMFMDDFQLLQPHNLMTVVNDIIFVGRYIDDAHPMIHVDPRDVPAMIMKGYRDMVDQLDSLDDTPDSNHR
jgi:Flp pilus assembly CpaF family ATPase